MRPGDRLNFSVLVNDPHPAVMNRMRRPRTIPMLRMTLTDATGKRLVEQMVQGEWAWGWVRITLPIKATFSVATKTKEMAIPFELKDLPLPQP